MATSYKLQALLAVLLVHVLYVQGSSGPRDTKFAPQSNPEALGLAKKLAAMTDVETAQFFNEYKTKFNKKYSSVAEEQARYGHFKASIQDVVEVNSNPNTSWFAGFNSFSDVSWEDFKAQMLLPERTNSAPTTRYELKENTAVRKLQATIAGIPDKVDWFTGGNYSFPVQNQMNCGSCWVMATVAAMESHALIKGTLASTAPENKMSEQQLIDCVYPTRSGCRGGWGYDAFNYMYTNKLVTTAQYSPYLNGWTGYCRTTNVNDVNAVTTIKPLVSPGWYQVPSWKAGQLFTALATQGPTDMWFQATTKFKSYASGIYTDECNSKISTAKSNHEMAAVGYDITAGLGNAKSYILVKNSWGAGWGENGLARIHAMAEGSAGVCWAYNRNYYPAMA